MAAVNARYYPEVALGRVFMGTTAVSGNKPMVVLDHKEAQS